MSKLKKLTESELLDAIEILKELEFPDSFYTTADLRRSIQRNFEMDVKEKDLVRFLVINNDQIDRMLTLKNILV